MYRSYECTQVLKALLSLFLLGALVPTSSCQTIDEGNLRNGRIVRNAKTHHHHNHRRLEDESVGIPPSFASNVGSRHEASMNGDSRRLEHMASIDTGYSLTMPSLPFNEMDQNFVELSLVAAKLSKAINGDDEDIMSAYGNAKVWTDEPDKAMITKLDDICFVAFRATTWTLEDWWQNLNPNFSRLICNDKKECCSSRRGFKEAFADVDYLDDLNVALEHCQQDCCADPDDCSQDEMCDLVLTGTSQGGAVAHVASFYWQDYDPITITFGQPQTIEEPCASFNTERLFRYVNTIEVHGKLKYDAIPFLDSFGIDVDHMGHQFVLAPNEGNVAYYKDSEAPEVTALDWAFFNIFDAHGIKAHIGQLEDFVEAGNYPIDMDGWSIGQVCTRNSECTSPHICGRGHCSEGKAGDSCWYESDCLPGLTCEGILSPKCEGKKSTGAYCSESTDCISGQCKLSWKGLKCT